MGMRTNTAQWLPNQNRWQIKVQKDGAVSYTHLTLPTN